MTQNKYFNMHKLYEDPIYFAFDLATIEIS